MFLDILELRIENKKNSLRKNVLKMGSHIFEEKKIMCPQKCFKKKVQKPKTTKN